MYALLGNYRDYLRVILSNIILSNQEKNVYTCQRMLFIIFQSFHRHVQIPVDRYRRSHYQSIVTRMYIHIYHSLSSIGTHH